MSVGLRSFADFLWFFSTNKLCYSSPPWIFRVYIQIYTIVVICLILKSYHGVCTRGTALERIFGYNFLGPILVSEYFYSLQETLWTTQPSSLAFFLQRGYLIWAYLINNWIAKTVNRAAFPYFLFARLQNVFVSDSIADPLNPGKDLNKSFTVTFHVNCTRRFGFTQTLDAY